MWWVFWFVVLCNVFMIVFKVRRWLNMFKIYVFIIVNGDFVDFLCDLCEMLLDCLCDKFVLMGVKEGCGIGDCGVCLVEVDGCLVCFCLMLGVEVNGKFIVMVEGIVDGDMLYLL